MAFALLLVASAFALEAQPAPTAELVEAARHFEAGSALAAADDLEGARVEFAAALLRYELAAQQLRPGANGRLLYNIGNTHVRLGNLGEAVLALRRAQRLIPGDRNLAQSLRHARSLRQDTIERTAGARIGGALFFWHRLLPAHTRAAVLVVTFNAGWLASLALVFRRRLAAVPASGPRRSLPAALRPALRWTIAVCAVAAVAMAGSLLTASRGWLGDEGVVLAAQVVGRRGDSESYEPTHAEPLHSGTEFRLLEARGGWYHVVLADASRAWIPSAAAGLLADDD